MYNPILEKRKELINNIQKSFEHIEDSIEKAKWQIGEVRVDSRGIAHECYEYTAEGKPRLRRVKKNKNVSTSSTDGGEKQIKVESKDVEKKSIKELSIDELKKKIDSIDGDIKYLEGQVELPYNYNARFQIKKLKELQSRRDKLVEILKEKQRKEKKEDVTIQAKIDEDVYEEELSKLYKKVRRLKIGESFSTKLSNGLEIKVKLSKQGIRRYVQVYSGDSYAAGNESVLLSKVDEVVEKELKKEDKKSKKNNGGKKSNDASTDDKEKDLAEIPVNGRIKIDGVGYFKKVGKTDWVKFDPNTGKESDKRINYTKISDNGYVKGVTIVDSSGKSKENNKKSSEVDYKSADVKNKITQELDKITTIYDVEFNGLTNSDEKYAKVYFEGKAYGDSKTLHKTYKWGDKNATGDYSKVLEYLEKKMKSDGVKGVEFSTYLD